MSQTGPIPPMTSTWSQAMELLISGAGGRDAGDTVLELALLGSGHDLRVFHCLHALDGRTLTSQDLRLWRCWSSPPRHAKRRRSSLLVLVGRTNGRLCGVNRNNLGEFNSATIMNVQTLPPGILDQRMRFFATPAAWNRFLVHRPGRWTLELFKISNEACSPPTPAPVFSASLPTRHVPDGFNQWQFRCRLGA